MKDEPAMRATDISVDLERNETDTYIRQFADRFLTMEGIGVLLIDSEFRIVEVSDMICTLFGCARADLIGRLAEEWMDSFFAQIRPFDRSLIQGISFRNRELNGMRDEISFKLLLDGDTLREGGRITGAYVLFRDVSHLLALEEQIRRSDRLKTIGQIAAGTAHEIRNPLTAMKGFMQLLNRALADREMAKEQEFVNIVLMELERVNDLVSDFLLLSKPKEVKHSTIRIGNVMQEILPMIGNEALLHNVTLHYHPKPELNPILADKELLKQVFLNLGKNAIEAMSGGGTLIIRENHYPYESDKIAIEILDTGPGIPPDVLEKVFDPFFTTKSQGTGLGLSVCQRIIHDLGGSIDVTSGHGGTRFTVWIPYDAGLSGA